MSRTKQDAQKKMDENEAQRSCKEVKEGYTAMLSVMKLQQARVLCHARYCRYTQDAGAPHNVEEIEGVRLPVEIQPGQVQRQAALNYTQPPAREGVATIKH